MTSSKEKTIMPSVSETSTAPAPFPRAATTAGYLLSGLVILFLIADGAMKLVPLDIVTEASGQLGWPASVEMARTLGVLTLVGTLLYAWPPTSVLGAILLTGYLGGAIATHLRIGSPLFTHLLFGVYLGLMIWGGLWLREPRLRALMPLRS
jgi:hypothetical protein